MAGLGFFGAISDCTGGEEGGVTVAKLGVFLASMSFPMARQKKKSFLYLSLGSDIVYGDFEFGNFRRNFLSLGPFPFLTFFSGNFFGTKYFDCLGQREAGWQGQPPLLPCTRNGTLWLHLTGPVPHLWLKSVDIINGDFKFRNSQRNFLSLGNFPLPNFLLWPLLWYQALYLYFD